MRGCTGFRLVVRISIHLVDNNHLFTGKAGSGLSGTHQYNAEGQSDTTEFRIHISIENIIITTHSYVYLFKQYCLGSRQIFSRREKSLPRSRAVQKSPDNKKCFSSLYNYTQYEPIAEVATRTNQNIPNEG